MNMYRITCPSAYGKNTPGHEDPGSRQGHYVSATTAAAAVDIVRERDEACSTCALDVQAWSVGGIVRGTMLAHFGEAVERCIDTPRDPSVPPPPPVGAVCEYTDHMSQGAEARCKCDASTTRNIDGETIALCEEHALAYDEDCGNP